MSLNLSTVTSTVLLLDALVASTPSPLNASLVTVFDVPKLLSSSATVIPVIPLPPPPPPGMLTSTSSSATLEAVTPAPV